MAMTVGAAAAAATPRRHSLKSGAPTAPQPLPPAPRRASTLRRAGGASVGVGVHADGQAQPTQGGGGSGGGAGAPLSLAAGVLATPRVALGASGALADPFTAPPTPPTDDSRPDSREESGSGSGLTVASLKHLRRQRDKLSDEKAKVASELAALQEKFAQQRERVSVLECQLHEALLGQASLREEVRQAQAAESGQRQRAIAAESKFGGFQDSLSRSEAEVARLREALDAQVAATQASLDRGADTGATEDVRRLESEKRALEEALSRRELEGEALRQALAAATASAEKALALHAAHLRSMEQLRAAKLSEAINQKVELHISVPRVTLNYNNAPPLFISAASAFNDSRIRDFLSREVFPAFEPMWVRLDREDKAPDGSTKRAYSTKMLDKLTEAVKAFVKKSQQADEMTPPPTSRV